LKTKEIFTAETLGVETIFKFQKFSLHFSPRFCDSAVQLKQTIYGQKKAD
jgi:hypothetical protein